MEHALKHSDIHFIYHSIPKVHFLLMKIATKLLLFTTNRYEIKFIEN